MKGIIGSESSTGQLKYSERAVRGSRESCVFRYGEAKVKRVHCFGWLGVSWPRGPWEGLQCLALRTWSAWLGTVSRFKRYVLSLEREVVVGWAERGFLTSWVLKDQKSTAFIVAEATHDPVISVEDATTNERDQFRPSAIKQAVKGPFVLALHDAVSLLGFASRGLGTQ